KSSSTSGQWIPNPPPATRQFARCSGVADSRRGDQTSGTEIVRPSSRSTTRTSSVNRTSLTRSPARLSEVVIPGLHQDRLVLDDEPLDAAQLDRRESQVTRQHHRGQPELRRVVVAIDMDMRSLVHVVADEVEAIRTDPKNG